MDALDHFILTSDNVFIELQGKQPQQNKERLEFMLLFNQMECQCPATERIG